MREISKAGFYKNWFDIANSIEDKDERLNFYEMIFNYYFNEVEPDEKMTFLLKSLFLAIKANIDADLERKKGGAPMGNSNATKQPKKQPKNNRCFEVENNPKTNNDNDNDNVNDNVKENDDDNRLISFSSPFNIKELLINLTEQYGYKINKKSFSKIEGLIAANFVNPEQAIKERLEYIEEHYKNEPLDSKTALLFKSFEWALTTPKPAEKKPEKIKSIDYSTAPKKCDCGGSVTPWGVPNSVRCTKCSKTWELKNDLWVSTN